MSLFTDWRVDSGELELETLTEQKGKKPTTMSLMVMAKQNGNGNLTALKRKSLFVCLFWKCCLPQFRNADYGLSWCNKCFLPLPFVQQSLLISHCFIQDLSTPGHNDTVAFGISHLEYLTHSLYQYSDMATVSVGHGIFHPTSMVTSVLPSLLM